MLLKNSNILQIEWLKLPDKGKMKVTVPNEMKPGKTYQFDSFVQYIRIYTCIGNFQEYFDKKHCSYKGI